MHFIFVCMKRMWYYLTIWGKGMFSSCAIFSINYVKLNFFSCNVSFFVFYIFSCDKRMAVTKTPYRAVTYILLRLGYDNLDITRVSAELPQRPADCAAPGVTSNYQHLSTWLGGRSGSWYWRLIQWLRATVYWVLFHFSSYFNNLLPCISHTCLTFGARRPFTSCVREVLVR